MTDQAFLAGVSAVLLAAGMSKRMGDENKLLLEIDGSSMVRRTAENILEGGVGELVVVLGHHRQAVADALSGLPCRTVDNPQYQDGKVTSVHTGLAAVSPDAESVMICLADQPLLAAEDYRAFLLAAMALEAGKIAVPMVKGNRGNPVFLPANLKDEVLGRGLKFGCRNLMRDHPDLVVWVEMESPYFVRDIDTPEAYQTLTA
ncbi:MAG: nucleotidyltransferase family protein [Proteobacteria bacterium]|nr:nucleotidyltransferase family protein [Pseudomonadota bacterium]